MSRSTILLILEFPDIAKLFKLALEQAGYEVSIARDQHDGLEQCVNNPPSLIIVEYWFGGLDICRQIRAIPGLKNIPILVKGAGSPEHHDRARQAGATDVFGMIYDIEEIKRQIAKLINDD